MRAICLTLPTNRACADTIAALAREAAYAVTRFDVRVHLLILDSSAPEDFAAHADAADTTVPGVVVHHLAEAAQRDFLREVIERSGEAKPDLLLDLMLPDGVSYGACTNRAFLFAAALGCDSVHRRDSDSRYQDLDGVPVFPIHHELAALGHPARDVHADVDALDPAHADKPVVLAGASFIGDLSVDIEEIRDTDPDAYHDLVAQWAKPGATVQEKRELVAESFLGAGDEPFTADHATLALVDPMRVDMCNVAFHAVHEQVPLPPAVDTIGSDYFLLHLIRSATLPGLLHNRHIVNFHTGERKTEHGFLGYQTRLVKFFLSMLYLHEIYDRLARAGSALLDADHRVRADAVADLVRGTADLDTADNLARLDGLDRTYRRLGGRYARVADLLAEHRDRWLDEARRDVVDHAALIDAWAGLVAATRGTGVPRR